MPTINPDYDPPDDAAVAPSEFYDPKFIFSGKALTNPKQLDLYGFPIEEPDQTVSTVNSFVRGNGSTVRPHLRRRTVTPKKASAPKAVCKAKPKAAKKNKLTLKYQPGEVRDPDEMAAYSLHIKFQLELTRPDRKA